MSIHGQSNHISDSTRTARSYPRFTSI